MYLKTFKTSSDFTLIIPFDETLTVLFKEVEETLKLIILP